MRKAESILVYVMLFLPTALQVFWQTHNGRLPISDAGDNLRIASLLYQAFGKNLFQGLHSIFSADGKPVLFAVFSLPFVGLWKIHQSLPSAVFLICISLLNSILLFLLFCRFGKKLFAALFAAVIMTVPFVFTRHTLFMPEAVWLTWFLVSLNLWFRSDGIQRLWPSFFFGIAFGLMTLARPAETIVAFGIPLLVGLLFWNEPNWERISKIMKYLGASILTILAVCAGAYWNLPVWMLVSISVLPLLVHLVPLLKNGSRAEFFTRIGPVGMFFLSSTFLVTLWTACYATSLYIWIFDNSFGNGAKVNDQTNATRPLFEIVAEIVRTYGFVPLAALVCSVVLAFLHGQRQPSRQSFVIFFACAFAVLAMVSAYAVTGTSDLRRIFLSIMLLMVAIGSKLTSDWSKFGISEKRSRYTRVLTLVFAGILGLQTLVTLSVSLPVAPWLEKLKRFEFWTLTKQVAFPQPEPSLDLEVFRWTSSVVPDNASLAVFTLGQFGTDVTFDTETLRYVGIWHRSRLNFGTCWAYAEFDEFDRVVDRMKSMGFNHLILDGLYDPTPEPKLRSQRKSHSFFIEEFLTRIERVGENAASPRLKLVDKRIFRGRTVRIYKIVS